MSWQETITALQKGTMRAATPNDDGSWTVNADVKEAILDVFRNGNNVEMAGGFVDKHNIPARAFTVEDGVRMVPGGSSVRSGAYVASGVVIMPPAYINIGAFVDSGTMVDSNALVGSCAQIGKNVHLSAGVQIGGVLEPIGAMPVIIEDDAFIGAGSIVVEGMIIRKRAVLAPGVTLSSSIPVYDCVNEELRPRGADIPEGAVVVPGTRPIANDWAKDQGLSVQCPVIIKYRDENSDRSLALEDALR